ncbi:transposase, partial [Neisseria meningitidis]|uniref:transposase n=1 Tax=Neisseria meningitidis TaxID=487 RepID=UPI0035D47F2F
KCFILESVPTTNTLVLHLKSESKGLYKLGYKQHTRTDAEGYIEKLHITPANAHECKHLSPLLEGLPKGTTV